MNERPLTPGMIIGILGGGQLGRMLAVAAAELGLSCHVYCPDPHSPAFAVAAARTIAPYDDTAALTDFAASVDIVTYEFENIPAATVTFLATRVTVLPGARSLAVSQDRLSEKQLMGELGIPVPAFAPVATLADIYSALARTGRPAVLKTRRLGYDGKGQALIRAGDDLVPAWRAIGEAPAVMEALVPFSREISVILARARDGDMRAWDVTENRHKAGILDTATVPAAVTPLTAARAVAFAEQIAVALDHVGVLAVEMFVIGEGDDARSDGQRDRPARPQFRPLDGRRRLLLAIRAAYPGDLRLAAGRQRAPQRRGDGEPHRRRRRRLAGAGGRTRCPAASLRQGGSPPGPQDGPCQSGHTGDKNLSQTRRQGRR